VHVGAGAKIIGDSHGPVRIGSCIQILENAVLHLLPDNELVIEDDVVIGPGAMIHGCRIGRGSVVEPAAIVCDWSRVGEESIVRAGACVTQRHPPAAQRPRRVPRPSGRQPHRSSGPPRMGAALRRRPRHPPHRPLTIRPTVPGRRSRPEPPSGAHMTLTAEYDRLFIDKQSPDAYRSMSAVASAVAHTAEAAGLDQLLVELVNIRISQLNGCGFCLDLHVRRAVKNGETPQRLAVLPAWRDVDLFSPTEQAALALAETITMLPDHHTREREQLTDDQFSAISWIAITMNAFNRISIISGHPVRPRGC
jgi:AhpD family alkylhydroperoxidase